MQLFQYCLGNFRKKRSCDLSVHFPIKEITLMEEYI